MNTNRQNTWIGSPTKNQVVLVCFVWIIGAALLLAAMTNLFTEELKNRHSFILGLLTIPSLGVVITVIANYFKKRQ